MKVEGKKKRPSGGMSLPGDAYVDVWVFRT